MALGAWESFELEIRLLLVDDALSERVVATRRDIGLLLLSLLISIRVARAEIER